MYRIYKYRTKTRHAFYTPFGRSKDKIGRPLDQFLNKQSGTQFYDRKAKRSIILHKKILGGPLNSRRFPGFPGGFLNSSRFPGVVDTVHWHQQQPGTIDQIPRVTSIDGAAYVVTRRTLL